MCLDCVLLRRRIDELVTQLAESKQVRLTLVEALRYADRLHDQVHRDAEELARLRGATDAHPPQRLPAPGV